MRSDLRTKLLACASLAVALIAYAPPAPAQISMAPQAIQHYSMCVNQAKDRNLVYVLERGTKYRCEDDIAVSYYNYLGHQHIGQKRAREYRSAEPAGVFIYRAIPGVGKCWNMVENPEGQPVSFYGCDIYVEL